MKLPCIIKDGVFVNIESLDMSVYHIFDCSRQSTKIDDAQADPIAITL